MKKLNYKFYVIGHTISGKAVCKITKSSRIILSNYLYKSEKFKTKDDAESFLKQLKSISGKFAKTLYIKKCSGNLNKFFEEFGIEVGE